MFLANICIIIKYNLCIHESSVLIFTIHGLGRLLPTVILMFKRMHKLSNIMVPCFVCFFN